MHFVMPWNEPPIQGTTSADVQYLSSQYINARNQQAGLPNGAGQGEIPAALLRSTARAILICKVLVLGDWEDSHRARACPPLTNKTIRTSFQGQCCPTSLSISVMLREKTCNAVRCEKSRASSIPAYLHDVHTGGIHDWRLWMLMAGARDK
jgi:hypothetical protein